MLVFTFHLVSHSSGMFSCWLFLSNRNPPFSAEGSSSWGRNNNIKSGLKKQKKLLIKAGLYYGWAGSRRVQNDPGQLWRPVALSSCNIIQTGFMGGQFEQRPHREHSNWIREDINSKGFITAGLNAGGEKKAATSPPGFRPRWGALQEDVSTRFGMWDKSVHQKCRLAQQDLKHLWVLGLVLLRGLLGFVA